MAIVTTTPHATAAEVERRRMATKLHDLVSL